MSHTSLFAVSLGGLLLIATTPLVPAAAQQSSDSLRTEALRDFHGPDLTGKDGPLAKAGLELLLLYHEYRTFQKREGDTFSPSVASARVTDGFVTIDAIAATEADRLRADLKNLGLKDAATAGRIVSGRFPIDEIPALAKLQSLRSVLLSRAQTHGDAASTPTEPPRQTPGDRSTETSNEAAAADDSSGEIPFEKDSHGDVLFFFLGVLIILLLTEL